MHRAAGTTKGMLACTILRLARVMRWATVASEVRKARAISPVVRPTTARSVSATCASRPSAGWQQVNSSGRRSSGPRDRSPSTWRVVAGWLARLELLQLGRVALGPPEAIERVPAGDGAQPRPGLGRYAVATPGGEGLHDRLGDGLLGDRQIAAPPGEGGDELARLVARRRGQARGRRAGVATLTSRRPGGPRRCRRGSAAPARCGRGRVLRRGRRPRRRR